MPPPRPLTESDFHDPLQGGQRGTRDTSFFFPQTVVREFQIVRAGATAEVGDTNAGFINVVTKEGSNKLRGEAFYIGRPSPLSSADTFGHSLITRRTSLAAPSAAPSRRTRSFYYVGAEQDYLNIPYWTQFAPQAPGTCDSGIADCSCNSKRSATAILRRCLRAPISC